MHLLHLGSARAHLRALDVPHRTSVPHLCPAGCPAASPAWPAHSPAWPLACRPLLVALGLLADHAWRRANAPAADGRRSPSAVPGGSPSASAHARLLESGRKLAAFFATRSGQAPCGGVGGGGRAGRQAGSALQLACCLVCKSAGIGMHVIHSLWGGGGWPRGSLIPSQPGPVSRTQRTPLVGMASGFGMVVVVAVVQQLRCAPAACLYLHAATSINQHRPHTHKHRPASPPHAPSAPRLAHNHAQGLPRAAAVRGRAAAGAGRPPGVPDDIIIPRRPGRPAGLRAGVGERADGALRPAVGAAVERWTGLGRDRCGTWGGKVWWWHRARRSEEPGQSLQQSVAPCSHRR